MWCRPTSQGSAPIVLLLARKPTLPWVVGGVDFSGSDPSLALIAAEELNMQIEAVSITHDNTDTMPYSGLAAGSKTTYTVGSAVQAAAREARQQIFTIAAEMLEAAAEDMELRNGKVMGKGGPEKYVTLQQIAANSMNFGAPYEPVFGP